VQSVLLFLPDIFHSKVTAYTNPDYAESLITADQALNWYVNFSIMVIKWISYTMVLFIYFFGRKVLKERRDILTLFCYSLLLYSFSNIFSLVPSGGRFIAVADSFMFPLIIIFIATFPKIRGLFIIEALSLPLLLLFCIVRLRVGMDYFGLLTILGNPLIAVFYTDTIPFIVGIKSLL
jgi:hypothetical protein